MSEFASRGRGHDTGYAPRSPSHADSYRPAERTAAQKADDAVISVERDIHAVDTTLKAIAKAKDANDPSAWHSARERLGPALATVEKELARARTRVGDASADAKQRLATAEKELEELQRTAANIGDPPLGWHPVSRETTIVAILDTPIAGSARDGWARKMSALKTELAQLSVPESRALATRLRQRQANDPIAKALAPGVRITGARFKELLAFLDGARRREALNSTRQPARHDAVHAETPLSWQPDSIVIERSTAATPASGSVSTPEARQAQPAGHVDVVHDPALVGAPLAWNPAAESIMATASTTAAASPAHRTKLPVQHLGVTHMQAGPTSAGRSARDANVMSAFGIEPKRQVENAGVAFGDTEMFVQRARELVSITGETLLPAFRAAIDALDAPASLQLAHACVQGITAVLAERDRAKARARDADPLGRAKSQPGHAIESTPTPPVEVWELDAHKRLDEDVAALEREVTAFAKRVAIEMSPQLFRGVVIGNGVRTPPGAEASSRDVVIRESSTTVDLVITYNHIRALLWPVPWMATREKKTEAVSALEGCKSRPINFQFLKHVLIAEGLWDVLANQTGDSGRTLTTSADSVDEQAEVTGGFGDVGEWDASRARSLLATGDGRWFVSDGDAQKVFDMIASAAPAIRGQLVLQLDRMGKLGGFCEKLPWRWVSQLHDAVNDPSAKAKLRPFFQGKGGGESLSRVYERNIMENVEEGNYVRGYLWTLLDTAHSALTFGFKDVHDAAYDAREAGLISDDAYSSTTVKGLGRAAAIMAATAATGGAAGAWGEGVAAGLGAGKTTAQIIGGAIGGGAAGVSGQFTGDVYDQALLGKQGFSGASDYAIAGLTGAGTGALTAGVQAAGTRYLPQSAKTMSHVYAERYPGLDNTLTRIRNAGIREGLVLRVTAQELHWLAESGLTNSANLAEALARIRMVYQNGRIDVQNRTLAKVHPQTEIEQFYGDIDPGTGRVTVKNNQPSSAGYVADAEQLARCTMDSDQSVREALGIDTDVDFYQKYHGREGALFEVTFKVRVELDVPLPQSEAPGTPLGTMNEQTHHRAGIGKTKGDVQEGKLPRGTPIEIVDIRPIGSPRSSYPPTGRPYGPYPPARPEVRNLPAPVSGASAGAGAAGTREATRSAATEDKEQHD